jgi:uncharacterized iron-regulated protein
MFTLIGLVVCAVLSVAAPTPVQATDDYAVYAAGSPRTLDAMLDDCAQADVVFVGENHDDSRAHALELAILQGLHRREPNLTFSLEMFERDTQGVLDEYLQGYITETQFLQAARPWPNYKADYRPLIEYCREQQIPVVAANAPRRYVNIVTRKGREALLALPSGSKTYLAPLPYSMDLPADYEKQLDAIFSTHDDDARKKESPAPQTGGPKQDATPTPKPESAPAAMPAMPSAANMKQAQALWDATMADSIFRAWRAHRGRKILQINGGMHSDSGYGIVARLRKSAPHLKIRIISIKPDADFAAMPSGKYNGIGDYVILTRPAQPAQP